MDKNNNNKEEGYRLPEGYWTKSKSHLESLQRLSAVGKEGYTLPDDYFAKSKKSILSKSKQNTKPRVIQLAKYFGAIAAIMLGVYLFPKLMTTETQKVDLFADLSEEEVQFYLEETTLDLDLIESDWIEDEFLDALFTEENNFENYLNENIGELDVNDMESFL